MMDHCHYLNLMCPLKINRIGLHILLEKKITETFSQCDSEIESFLVYDYYTRSKKHQMWKSYVRNLKIILERETL